MIEPIDFFSAKEHTLKTFLTSGNKKFRVPDYQRNYAWTDNELEQLWVDFKQTVTDSFDDNYSIRMNHKPHFFGTVLLTKDDSGIYEITDGQQRLTTSSIFLKAMLDIAQRLDSPQQQAGVASMILPLLQTNDYGEPFSKRLYLDSRVDSLYEDFILKTDTDFERTEYLRVKPVINPNTALFRLKYAYNFFSKKLNNEFPSDLSQNQLHIKLISFIQTLTRLFMLLEIVVNESETAYTIFGTLNNRGKDLTDSDIIKNELFKSVGIGQREEIKEKWDSIIDSIEDEDLTEYIRFQFASTYSPVKLIDLFSAVTKYIKENDCIEYLETLSLEADWYARINLIGTQYWDERINSKLKAFKSLDITHCIPLLLTGAVLYNNDANKFERLVNNTLVFCFRYFTILKNSVADLEREIGVMSRSLRKPKDLNSLSKEEIESLQPFEKIVDLDSLTEYMNNLTSDSSFSRGFSEFLTKSSSLAFYILNELEKNRLNGVIPLPHGPSQHIEHIMPKKPSAATSRTLEWSHVRHNPEYKYYVHRLGNMLILESDINTQVSNKEFGIKKNLYLNSDLSYPRHIAASNSIWDFASITSRQQLMAQEALNVWRYF